MTVQLPMDLDDFVRQSVESGDYASAQDVVIDAVQVLRGLTARQEQLRKDVQIGVDQLERGEYIELNDEAEIRQFFADISARGRAKLGIENKA